jgi:DNA-binding GntR family transcriptional regulator
MQSILDHMKSHPGADDSDAVVRDADRFHDAILEAARSPRLAAQLGQIHQRITYFRNLSLRVPGRAEEAAREHQVLLTPIRSGDAHEAERLMREHIDRARLVVGQLTSKQGNEPSWA